MTISISSTDLIWIAILGVVTGIIIAVIWLKGSLQSPFRYPYFTYVFDVSGKRNPQIENLLDEFLIKGGFEQILAHQDIIEQWKSNSLQYVNKCFLKKLRMRQYQASLSAGKDFHFYFVRTQTRYRQSNYVKYPYQVLNTTNTFTFSLKDLEQRYAKLADINFVCSLQEYHNKNQRRLVTQKLREEIMERDAYTCQLCGKVMLDKVGLQIDHIIPISKGGKTVPSNLRVLCSKCNGSKGSKIPQWEEILAGGKSNGSHH